jgi:ribonuclease R
VPKNQRKATRKKPLKRHLLLKKQSKKPRKRLQKKLPQRKRPDVRRPKQDVLPSREEILNFVKFSPTPVGKREIARHFGIKSQQKILLKVLLKDMSLDGDIEKGRDRHFHESGGMPKMGVLRVVSITEDGEVFAQLEREDEFENAPRIRIVERKGKSALGLGDRVLARIEQGNTGKFRAFPLKQLERKLEPVLGIIRKIGEKGEGVQYRLEPTDRKIRTEFMLTRDDLMDAAPGELVLCEPKGKRPRGLGLQQVKVTERLGNPFAPKAVSLIAIYKHGLKTQFSDAALAEARQVSLLPLGDREDLRAIPLITIDPSDARDHDDAIFATQDDDVLNPGGWRAIVAIADVSFYVRAGTTLDAEARERGNSTYFPDRVVPMLPEILSADVCSLMPHVDRACLACHLIIDENGKLKSWRFSRAVMRSHANLSYEQAQDAINGKIDPDTQPILDSVLKPLWGAWKALKKARDARAPLNLDLPERRVVLNDAGEVTQIKLRTHLDSHQVVEDFMISANVAAARQLEQKQSSVVYRAHLPPAQEKIIALKEFLESSGQPFALGQVMRPAVFNSILDKIKGSDVSDIIQEMILRTQTQAYYTAEHLGHFGLSLTSYAHFTSPIRRYSDLVLHRLLVSALKFGAGGSDAADIAKTCEHISMTERRSMLAERETTDRYVAMYLSKRVGEILPGRITSVTRFGLFVTIEGIGGDGLILISTLGSERFTFIEKQMQLVGDVTGTTYRLGQRLPVKLVEASAVSGGMRFELAEPAPVPDTGSQRNRPGGAQHARRRFKRR